MFNKDRYIHLQDRPGGETKVTEFKTVLENQVVRLSGKHWKWVWNRPSGVLIQKGDQENRVPVVDVTRILEFVIYGISFLLVLLGLKGLGGKRGKV
jgi:hypothetical protein